MTKTKTVRFRADDETEERLNRLALLLGIDHSKLIRYAVESLDYRLSKPPADPLTAIDRCLQEARGIIQGEWERQANLEED